MTTTVTVKTHTWPVRVETSSSHNYSDGQRSSYGHQGTQEFVPANSERSFAVTDTTSVSFYELPQDAVDLNHGLSPTPDAAAALNLTAAG